MAEENTQKNKNEEKQDQKYDRKLYNQAVKAAKEAKILEKKNKRRKELKRYSLYFLLLVMISIGIYLIIPLFEPKDEYVVSQEISDSLKYVEISEKRISSSSDMEISLSNLSGQSILAFDPVTGDVLFEKNSKEKMSIASLTKLLTAIVVLENFKTDDFIEVKRSNIPEDMDWQLGLKEGDRVSIENLLKAMLISSYNDTAYIVANSYPNGGYDGFIKEMNMKAKELKMISSHFSNPAGIDDIENYSTAYDVAILVSVARKYPMILETVDVGKDIVSWNSQGEFKSKEVITTNQLYGVNRYIRGMKTGITDLAGQCFAGYFVYPNGKELLTVVINSQDRFTDTANLEKYAREYLRR